MVGKTGPMAAAEVPPALGRLWRVRSGSRLGRPAELDVDRVVRAAVELADREGLAAVTLSRVAKELDCTTMALYRHVGSKEELYLLMSDSAAGAPPALDAAGWRDGLRQWALADRAVHGRHAWLARLPVSGPPSGPNAIAWLDAGLRVLRDTGLDWGAKVGVLTVLSAYVRSSAQMSQEFAAGRSGTGRDQTEVERDYGRALARLVDEERFPEASRLFASDLFETVPEPVAATSPVVDPDFDFGLELILAGVAAAVAASR
ncbi:TetR family transcriptional regulator [Pseudonocardia cypriaca]|uniref:TetR family transcriptional regulator n=2 Tax=Pseudonocardia cypriaca TaxID=882449 RepID=A0A543FQP9_9PSEU|nr:TetR family transcriptional regulator [Pseudonocardia cypriaca]